MYTTTMPGFSAEASHYRGVAYRQFGGMTGPRAEMGIVPAIPCSWHGGREGALAWCCGTTTCTAALLYLGVI